MAWLQENYIVAVVGLVVAIVLLWWLVGRSKPDDLAPPAAEPAKPAKPLEPVKPEIIAAEPARFKPIEPQPQLMPQPQPMAPPVPTPVAEPVAKAPPAPEPAPIPEPIAQPAPPAPAPKAAAPKPAATPKPAPKPAVRKVAEKPPAAKPAKKAAVKPAPAEPAAAPAPDPTPTAAAKADNLQLLKGVGPKMVGLLNGLGVTSFQQIAEWTDADVAAIDPQLGAFQGRIARDNIVDQAGYLARGDKPGFETKYGALGGEI